MIAPAFTQQSDQAIKLQTDLVTIDATVTDKNGGFIRKLSAEDFAVYEDGQPQKVEFFEANEEAALTRSLAVVFALDKSGSIRPEEIDKQREATEGFVRLVRPESLFAVITFSSEIRVLQDFTSEPEKNQPGFQKDRRGRQARRGYSGRLTEAVSMLKRAPRFRGGRRLRRVVIVITDGFDNLDSTDQQDLIRRANDAEVTVYSITLPSYMAASKGGRSMTLLDVSRIVPMTGGADFSADTKDFTPVFKAIAEEIRSGYTIAYYPPEGSRRDGRVHQISVEVQKAGRDRAHEPKQLSGSKARRLGAKSRFALVLAKPGKTSPYHGTRALSGFRFVSPNLSVRLPKLSIDAFESTREKSRLA